MRIPVITGTVQEPYKVLDSVCAYAVGGIERTFDFDTEIHKVFNSVKDDLRSACKAIGGNAVINCKFEVRNLPFYGKRAQFSRTEITVQGTAVLSARTYTNDLVSSEVKFYSLMVDNHACVNCPICNEKLRLDSYEIKSRCFQCTKCKNEIKFKGDAP